MKQKSKNGVSIIGGADGPTSVFIAGHSKKQPLKLRIKNSIYRYKSQICGNFKYLLALTFSFDTVTTF